MGTSFPSQPQKQTCFAFSRYLLYIRGRFSADIWSTFIMSKLGESLTVSSTLTWRCWFAEVNLEAKCYQLKSILNSTSTQKPEKQTFFTQFGVTLIRKYLIQWVVDICRVSLCLCGLSLSPSTFLFQCKVETLIYLAFTMVTLSFEVEIKLQISVKFLLTHLSLKTTPSVFFSFIFFTN